MPATPIFVVPASSYPSASSPTALGSPSEPVVLAPEPVVLAPFPDPRPAPALSKRAAAAAAAAVGPVTPTSAFGSPSATTSPLESTTIVATTGEVQYVCPTCCERRGYLYKYRLGGPSAYTLQRRASLPPAVNPRPFPQTRPQQVATGGHLAPGARMVPVGTGRPPAPVGQPRTMAGAQPRPNLSGLQGRGAAAVPAAISAGPVARPAAMLPTAGGPQTQAGAAGAGAPTGPHAPLLPGHAAVPAAATHGPVAVPTALHNTPVLGGVAVGGGAVAPGLSQGGQGTGVGGSGLSPPFPSGA